MLAAGERVVITGIGAVTAFGWTSRDLWRGLVSGCTSVRKPIVLETEGQRTELASEAPRAPLGLEAQFLDWPELSRADRFAVAAAAEAACQAGLLGGAPVDEDDDWFRCPGRFDPLDPESILGSLDRDWEESAKASATARRIGVYFGGSTAGMAEAESYYAQLIEDSGSSADHLLLASQPLNGPGDAVARRLRANGPVGNLSSACASGGLAIGAALTAVRAGEVDIAIAGGADSLCRLTYSGFNSLRAIDPNPCRPFRADRAGLSLGEGAGVLVLESEDHARSRGAVALAEARGAGASCDAFHMTAPDPEGRGATAAMRSALADAWLEPQQISFVNAHGTGTPHNDSSESRAIARVFGTGAARLPVTSTKSYIGHLLGAAGAVEAVATVQCLRNLAVHTTVGDGDIDPQSPVDLVLGAERPISSGARAISTSFAFGGANAAVILAGIVSDQEHRR